MRIALDQMDRRGVSVALIQDLTGHDVRLPLPLPLAGGAALLRLKDLLFMTGAESHPRLPGLVRGCLAGTTPSLAATPNANVGDLGDHYAFRTLGLPYLFFSCGRWEHYHRPSDTPEKLSFGKMARIAALLEGIARDCAAAGDLPRADAEGNTAAFEIELLERAFGPLLPLLLRVAGVSKLQGRAELDALVAALAGLGL